MAETLSLQAAPEQAPGLSSRGLRRKAARDIAAALTYFDAPFLFSTLFFIDISRPLTMCLFAHNNCAS
jgi:hypothetical protein